MFYLFGGVLNVPFLALGTVFLLAGPVIGRRVAGVSLVSAFAAGVISSHRSSTRAADVFPTGKDHFGVLPRCWQVSARASPRR